MHPWRAIAWLLGLLMLAVGSNARALQRIGSSRVIQRLEVPPAAAVSPVRAQRAPQRLAASVTNDPRRPRARASTDLGETARQRRASGGTPGNLNSVTLPDTRTLRYLTDAENRRVAKLVDGTLQRAWLYQDSLKPIAELDANGFVTSRFIYASRSNVPDVMLQGDTTYALISDVRGSVRLVVDSATGEVAQRIDHGPFGDVLSDSNPGFQPFGFAGGLYDPDTGLRAVWGAGL